MKNEKIKVIIIDDEFHIRKLLRKATDWAAYNMEVINEAANADEAYKLIDEEVPDVIVTDICMPQVDGLEFSKGIIKRYPKMKIVVVTGYDNFEYARKAIKIGVFDFLLKPIDDEEMANVLTKLSAIIQDERQKDIEYISLRSDIQKDLPYLRERFFRRLVNGEQLDESEANKYSIDIKQDYCRLIALEFFKINSLDSHSEIKNLFRQQSSEYIKSFFADLSNVYCFTDRDSKCLVLINQQEQDVISQLDSIREKCNEQFECYVNIGISKEYNSIWSAEKAYDDAKLACEYRLIIGNNQTIYSEDVVLLNGSTHNLIEQIKKYRYAVKAVRIEKANKFVEQCFSGVDINKGVKDIRTIASNFIAAIKNICEETGIDTEGIFINMDDPFEVVFQIETTPRMIKYIQSITEKTIDKLKSEKDFGKSNIVKRATTIINNEYSSSELSLSYIAETLFISSSYLSRAFKKETGKNLVAYILDVRINKAIELSSNSEYKAYEIAEKVGFSSEYYFSTCFKKYTGISFSKFNS